MSPKERQQGALRQMPTAWAGLFAFAFALLALSPGLTSAARPAVAIRYFTKVPQGQTPRLEFTAQEPTNRLTIRLTRDDGVPVQATFGATGRGQTQTISLDGSVGRHQYTGEVVVGQGASEQTSSFNFETHVTANLQIQLDRRQVDFSAGTLTLTASRPIAEVQISTFASPNAGAQVVKQAFDQTVAGEPVQVRFAPAPQAARLDIKVTDADGFFTGVSLLPWSLTVPHEEVNFASDKADLVAAELPKLDASLKLIQEASKQARGLGPVALYIAGHTDTVGNDAYNLKLSLARAQAIARHFRKRGLRQPILFEGFGERALAVATPDETNESRNRRVDYILALEPPELGARDFQARWKTLP